MENRWVLRLIGLIIVLAYTGVGAMLVFGGDETSRIVGLALVLTGLAWLVVDVWRRRPVM